MNNNGWKVYDTNNNGSKSVLVGYFLQITNHANYNEPLVACVDALGKLVLKPASQVILERV